MLKRHSKFLESLMLPSDLLVISGIWIAAYYFRFQWGSVLVYRGIPEIRPYLFLLGLIAVVWGLTFKAFRLYRPRRISSCLAEVRDIANAYTLAALVLVDAICLFEEYEGVLESQRLRAHSLEFDRSIFKARIDSFIRRQLGAWRATDVLARGTLASC